MGSYFRYLFVLITTLNVLVITVPNLLAKPPWCPSRYGPEDQIGAINEITPAKVLEAVQLVTTGKVYDMGILLERGVPASRSRSWSQMIVRGLPFETLGKNKLASVEEVVSGTYQIGTQIDGLGHVSADGLFYNCNMGKDIVHDWGLSRLGIENVPPVVTRGVLLDVASYKGMNMLEKGYVISVKDIEGTLMTQGSPTIGPGDAVLFHTGWLSLWMKDNEQFRTGEPGIGKEVAQWLIERRVAMAGADNNGFEVLPSEDQEESDPVHQMLLIQNGIYILENVVTEELARDQVYEFMFVLTRSKTKGSTAANISPAAVR